jgi:hypothetical protein
MGSVQMSINTFRSVLSGLFLSYMIVSSVSCSSDSKKAQEILNGNGSGTQSDTAIAAFRVGKVKSIFNKTPSAVDRIQLIKKSRAKYSESFPSDPTSASKYTSLKGQALNLGIYGADLAYAGIYEQKEEASLYLQCANKLATSLGIPQAFNEAVVSRIEANIGLQDSLLAIITQDYMNTDAGLTKDGRPQVSAFLIAGGWIEGFYLATQMATQTGSPDLASTAAGQKSALEDLMALIQTYPADGKMKDLLEQLKKIQAVLAPIQITPGQLTTVTPEQLKAMTDAAALVRNEVVGEF